MSKVTYICNSCFYESSKWLGKCPNCSSWNSFEKTEMKKHKQVDKIGNEEPKVYSFQEIEMSHEFRYTTGIEEFDRVLGGGLVKGSVVLFTGNPGIGKSTLLLQMLSKYSNYGKILYISGEESAEQVKNRGLRVRINNENFFLMLETELETITSYIEKTQPKIVAIDSIQTLYSEESEGVPGSISQIREAAMKFIDIAKSKGISFFLIGHVTKDGKIAGPKMLEHMVDTVINFEGEENFAYRILRSTKNRFGSTNEIGIFSMSESGIEEVTNPSEFFLEERNEKSVGGMVVPILDGNRVLLIEVQALVSNAVFGMPRRVTQGIDYTKLQMISAVVEKRLHINLLNQDIFLNIPGGLVTKDPALSLAVVFAMISSIKGKALNNRDSALGEVGLTGEVRRIPFVTKRLLELQKVGFKRVYIPIGNKKEIEAAKLKIEPIYISNISEIIEHI